MPKYRVTAVCLGNICRSPIGEVVLRERIAQAGLADTVVVDSAGTGDWHLGQGANHRTISVLQAHGYPHDHIARQISTDWLGDIDLLLAMDTANYADLRRMIEVSGADSDLRMFRSFDPELSTLHEPDPGLDVPDPYHGSEQDFVDVLRMLERASDGVVAHIAELVKAKPPTP